MSLEIVGISKDYRGKKRAVHNITMSLGSGIFGLLGPNGAGKSTLMRIIATVTRPTTGTVTWEGQDITSRPDALRTVLGYLPQDFGVYPNLNAREFLSYLAAVKRVTSPHDRIDELLRLVNLGDAAEVPLGRFSGGMRQRVGIAQALLNDPRLLIVDEPTAGLDPEERARFRTTLSELSVNRTVILSTHVVSDVEATADDITIMVGGQLARRDRPEELIRAADGLTWELTVPSTALPEYRARHVISRAVRTKDGVRLRVLSPTAPSVHAASVTPDLEDAYLGVVHNVIGQGAGVLG